jgi:hypothetical protein
LYFNQCALRLSELAALKTRICGHQWHFERSQLLSDMRISQYSSDKVPAEPQDAGSRQTIASRLAEQFTRTLCKCC